MSANNKTAKAACASIITLLMLLMGGCKGERHVDLNRDLGTGGGSISENPADTSLPEIDQASDGPWGKNGLHKVYFDYNSFALRPDALKTLRENAELIKSALKGNRNLRVQVEGHCDERGTQEYNLALGEKRALTVREHLIKLGLPADSMLTVSYGKERPVSSAHDETAWKQNRRCEFSKAPAAK